MTPEAISRRTTVPLEVIKKGLAALEQPDPESRTPDLEGRRIVKLSESRPWGWRLVNYKRYSKLRSEDDRREYHRRYYHEKRKIQQVSTLSTDSTDIDVNVVPPLTPPQKKKRQRQRQSQPKTPCPGELDVTEEMSAWAQDHGLPADRVMPETEKFLDYWRADGRYRADWLATWRSWIRKAVEYGQR